MSFLSPWFLLGALSLIVPVLVHLMRREPSARIPFASLLFLRHLPQPVHRRRRLRYWLLFALRSLLLLLLVLAFARPSWRSQGGEGRPGAAVVLLLDCSFSMRPGARFARAQEKALEILAQAPEGARVGAIGFSTTVRVLSPLSRDRANVRAALRDLRPTWRATDYAQGLRAARSLLQDAPEGEKTIYLISDFQRSGWRAADSEALLPPDVKLVPVDVASEEEGNRAILDAHARSVVWTPRYEEQLLVRVGNFHRAAARTAVRLWVNDRLVGEKTLALGPEETTRVAFTDFPLDPRLNRVRVELEPDGLPDDDRFFLIIERGRPKKVLLLEGTPGASFYLRQALWADEAFGPERVLVRTLAQGVPADMSEAEIVVLVNPAELDVRSGEALRRFVLQGGGMVIALGSQADAEAFHRALGHWLGVRLERERARGPSLLTEIQTEHPLFRPFADPRRANFSSVRFYGYAKLSPVAQGTEASAPLVLARFHAGDPALVEIARGKGKVLLLAFGLDAHESTLPLTPLYAPLVHQMLAWVRTVAPRTFFRVGESVSIEGASRDAPVSVQAPSGERIQPAGELSADFTRLVPEQIGFYRLRHTRGEEFVAVNVEAGESDLRKMGEPEKQRWLASLRGEKSPSQGSREDQGEGRASDEAGSERAWRWFLLVAMALLLSEALLADRAVGKLGRSPRANPSRRM